MGAITRISFRLEIQERVQKVGVGESLLLIRALERGARKFIVDKINKRRILTWIIIEARV